MSQVQRSELPSGTFSLGCVWMVCPPEADTGGQVAAVIGTALSSHGVKATPRVTAAAIGERVGGVGVVL